MVSEGIQNKKRETTLFRTCFKNETHTHIKYFITYKTDLQLVPCLMFNPNSGWLTRNRHLKVFVCLDAFVILKHDLSVICIYIYSMTNLGVRKSSVIYDCYKRLFHLHDERGGNI